MTSPLSNLEALERAATPRPWAISGDKIYTLVWNTDPEGMQNVPIIGIPKYETGPVSEILRGRMDNITDRELIAAMRNALPALLRVARAAKAWTDWDWHNIGETPKTLDGIQDKCDRLKIELELALTELEASK